MNPTINLAHGAFADSASWNGVVPTLLDAGHRVIAAAVPLRTLAGDAAAMSDIVRSVDGPVVLVGHSYAGAVITNVDPGAGTIAALVYVNGFALDAGENCATASELAPGGTLGETLVPVPLSSGGADLYIDQAKYHAQFAADLPPEQARVMAVTQRPIMDAALSEASTSSPLWRTVPSWFIFGELDKNIPVGAHRIMAERAGARRVVEVPGGSHVMPISQPAQTAALILEAAAAEAPVPT